MELMVSIVRILRMNSGSVPYATRILVFAASGSRITSSVRVGSVQERPAPWSIDPSMQGTRREGRSCVEVEDIVRQGVVQTV